MRLTTAVALLVNVVTLLLLGIGLATSTVGCTGPDCTTGAAVLGPAVAAVAAGLVVWWRRDPRLLLAVDVILLTVTWAALATGSFPMPRVGSMTLAWGGPGLLLPFGAVALGRLSLGRSATGDAARPTAPRPDREATIPAGLTALMDRIDRLPPDGVRLLAVRPLDRAAHDRARELALARLAEGGRLDALEATRTAVATWVRRWQGGEAFDPTFVAVAWRHEPLGAEDRIRLLRTIQDAAIAELAADLVDEPTFDELLGPCATLVGPVAPDEPGVPDA